MRLLAEEPGLVRSHKKGAAALSWERTEKGGGTPRSFPLISPRPAEASGEERFPVEMLGKINWPAANAGREGGAGPPFSLKKQPVRGWP